MFGPTFIMLVKLSFMMHKTAFYALLHKISNHLSVNTKTKSNLTLP